MRSKSSPGKTIAPIFDKAKKPPKLPTFSSDSDNSPFKTPEKRGPKAKKEIVEQEDTKAKSPVESLKNKELQEVERKQSCLKSFKIPKKTVAKTDQSAVEETKATRTSPRKKTKPDGKKKFEPPLKKGIK